jgi:dephospho-CoA kinase
MLTYGLTGGIGTGKSTVARMFQELGIPVFDADDLGRRLLSEAGLANEVLRCFPDCAEAPGRVDRQKLAERVFSDAEARRTLEDLLHPAIRDEFENQKHKLPRPGSPYCLIEGAVFLESRTDFGLSGLIVVTAPERTRCSRLQKRDGTDESRVRRRISAQFPQYEKIQAATHVIDNAGGIEGTRRRVEEVADLLAAENGEAG